VIESGEFPVILSTGHSGTVSFTKLTQGWLREAAKRWAADDLPRRRIRAGRRTSAGLAVRHHVGCLVRLSASLRMRPGRGEHPAVLGRGDMGAFLHRLAYQQSAGQISADARVRACRGVRHVLTRIRAMGQARPSGTAAGLGEDFAIGVGDIPTGPGPAEPGRGLPPEIMRQLCAQLDQLCSAEMRTGTGLAIDTGRRPEEICDLAFDCLARDADGLPVLVYDNHKAQRLGRRLPTTQHTARLTAAQQQRVQARYPHTPVGDLKLLPTGRRNPDGRKAVTGFSLSVAHRAWVSRMPVLRTADGLDASGQFVAHHVWWAHPCPARVCAVSGVHGVHPDRLNRDHDLVRAWLGRRKLLQAHGLRATRLLYDKRAHDAGFSHRQFAGTRPPSSAVGGHACRVN